MKRVFLFDLICDMLTAGKTVEYHEDEFVLSTRRGMRGRGEFAREKRSAHAGEMEGRLMGGIEE